MLTYLHFTFILIFIFILIFHFILNLKIYDSTFHAIVLCCLMLCCALLCCLVLSYDVLCSNRYSGVNLYIAYSSFHLPVLSYITKSYLCHSYSFHFVFYMSTLYYYLLYSTSSYSTFKLFPPSFFYSTHLLPLFSYLFHSFCIISLPM